MEADVRRVLARLTLDARGLQKAFQSTDPEVWDRAIATVMRRLADVSLMDWDVIADVAVTRIGWDPQQALSEMINQTSLTLQTSDLTTPGRRAALVNRILGLKARVENMVEDVRHTGTMIKIEDKAAEAGKYLVWMPERNACPRCLDLGGSVVAPGGDFTGMGLLGAEETTARRPPLHANCLTGDTLIPTSTRIASVSFRVFKGRTISITTTGGKHLTGTPNHPILTTRGWVTLGALNQCDELVVSSRHKRIGRGDHEEDDRVATIEDVVRAFLMTRGMVATEMPVSPEHFHNDGRGSEVAVIGTHGQLRDDLLSSVAEFVPNDCFQRGIKSSPSLLDLCGETTLFKGSDSSSYGIMRGSGERMPFLGRRLSHSEIHALRSTPLSDPVLTEESDDSSARYTNDLRQFLDTSSGIVHVEKIVRIVRNPFAATHVYNLQTDTGWFSGNSIVTHNCRCELKAISPDDAGGFAAGVKREAARSAALGMSSYASESKLSELAGQVAKTGVPLPKTVLAKARKLAAKENKPTTPLRKKINETKASALPRNSDVPIVRPSSRGSGNLIPPR